MTTKPVAKQGLPFKGRQDTTHTFEIDFTSGDGTNYRGKFTVKKLSVRDIAAMGVRKAQLNGGMHHDPSHPGQGVDYNTDEFNQIISHLEIGLIDTPPWWDLNNIFDTQVIGKVWEEVVQFEASFLQRSRGETPPERQGSSDSQSGGGDSQATYARRAPGAVVDAEVQAALEP